MNLRTFIKRTVYLLLLFIVLDYAISTILLKGLNKYYGIEQKADILINGSSMAMSGFNRTTLEKLTNKEIANYSHEGVSIDERLAMINYFFHKNPESVTTVIYEVNPLIFSGINTAANVYTIFYPYLDDRFIDRFVKERAGSKDYFIHKIIRTKRFDARLIPNIFKGYLGKYENLKTNMLDTANLSPIAARKGKTEVIMGKSAIETFENTMDVLRSHNSRIILVMMPMYYLKFQTFNSAGYQNLCMYFAEYCSSGEGIDFVDLNRDSLIYNASYFSDELHFNIYGQQQITSIITSALQKQDSK
jgi:hypothetical protein